MTNRDGNPHASGDERPAPASGNEQPTAPPSSVEQPSTPASGPGSSAEQPTIPAPGAAPPTPASGTELRGMADQPVTHPIPIAANPIAFTTIVAAMTAVGVLQLVLSRFVVQLDHPKFPYFSYWVSYHWSLTYLIPAPLLVGLAFSITYRLHELDPTRASRAIAAVVAFLLTVLMPFREWISHFRPSASVIGNYSYCGWNTFADSCTQLENNYAFQALYHLAYANYSLTGFMMFYATVRVILFSVRMLKGWPENTETPLYARLRDHQSLIRLYDSLVACLLVYLVMLRSSKVSISLSLKKVAEESSRQSIGIFVLSGSYWTTVQQGIVVFFLLAAGMIAVSIVARMALLHEHDENKPIVLRYRGADLIYAKVSFAFQHLRWTGAIWGAAMVGIAFPPPNLGALVGTLAIGIGFLLVRYSLPPTRP